MSQAANQRRPCPGRIVQCEAFLAIRAPKNPQNNPPGKNLGNLNLSSGQRQKHTRGHGCQARIFPFFSHPRCTPATEEPRRGGWRSRRTWRHTEHPQGCPTVKWQLPSYLPVGLGLEEIIRELGPWKCSEMFLGQREQGSEGPGGWAVDAWFCVIPDSSCGRTSAGARGAFAGQSEVPAGGR